MRLRTLLTTAVVSTLIAGATGMTAQATPISSPESAGTVVTWGDATDVQADAAMTVPDPLPGPVAALSTTSRSTAAVTADGHLRVWGDDTAIEVVDAPDVTDAVAVALSAGAGLVLHRDGTVTGWGSPILAQRVPEDLRAKAIAVLPGGALGYAVRIDGTLATWGEDEYLEGFPSPDLSGLVDVSAGQQQVLALRADGTVAAWGLDPAYNQENVPDFGDRAVAQIVAGPAANGVVLDDGTIEVWGQTIPAGDPDFAGMTAGPDETVVNLSLGSNAGAVTADGAVHTWGSNEAINDEDDQAALAGKPVASIAIGNKHAAVIVTNFRALTAPTVAGTPTVGQTLTATPGTLSLAPTTPATGQWYAGTDPIAGQTGTTLVLTQTMVGKKVSYKSTATRGAETVTSTSNEVGPVTPVTVASTTALTVTPSSGGYGAARTATATVTKTGGTPTGTVTFKVGSAEGTATLTAGKATWTLPTTLPVGTQTVTASYQGDATTAASTSAAATVIVNKAVSKVTAKAKVTGKTKKYAKKVTITVTVKTPAGVSPAGKVTVSLKGSKKATAKVNAKGKATVTIKKVKHGKHKATVSYAGNTNVSAAKTAINVKA